MTPIWEIQSTAVALLVASADLVTLAESAILADDGSYPKTPGREDALAGVGACIVVSVIGEPPPEVIDESLDGYARNINPITVWVDVRRTDTLGQESIQAEAAKMISIVQATLLGKPIADLDDRFVFKQPNPPYQPWGKFGADLRYGVLFFVESIIEPAS